MAGRLFRFDLKTRIAAAVLLLFVGGIWLLTYFTAVRLQREITEVLADQQFASVSHTAAEIEQKMQLRFDALRIIARQISPGLLSRPEQLRRFLEDRPLLQSFFTNGVVVISREGVGVADFPAAPDRAGGSFAELEYFREVMSGKKAALGKPRIGRFTKRLGVGFAVPISGSSEVPLGVLVGFAALDDPSLFGQIADARVGKTGWLAVNDARYRMIVAINDPKRIMQPFPAPGVNLMLDRYATGYEGSGISTNSQGREVLSSAKQIGKTGWFAQMVLPTEEAFEPLHGMTRRIYLSATVLSLLATVIIWLVIRMLLKPLAETASAMRRMADQTQELHELPEVRHDEIGDLVASFNILSRQRRTLEEELERLARTDALTGLPNRRYFMEVAAAELARAARYDLRLSVLMIDLDHFKRINDTHGHKTGDLVLSRFGDVCRTTLREIDVVARLGGEEFVALLPQTAHEAALEVAERLRLTTAETMVPIEQGLPLRFTVSIGVATLIDNRTNIDTLLSSADHALYEAKRLGRNRVCGGI